MARQSSLRSWAGRTVVIAAALGMTAAIAQQNNPGGQGQPNANPNANQGGQDQAAQGQNASPQEGEQAAEPAPQKLLVLRLQHAEPQQVVDLLRSLDQPSFATLQPEAYRTGYRGLPPGPAAAHAAAADQGQTQQQSRLLIAADDRSKTVFVRGPADRLGEIEALVKNLDSGEAQRAEISGVRIVPVRHVNQGEVTAILQQLQLPAATFQLGEKSVVVLRGDDEEQLSQAEEVVKALDQAPQTQPQAGQPPQGQTAQPQGQGGQAPSGEAAATDAPQGSQ